MNLALRDKFKSGTQHEVFWQLALFFAAGALLALRDLGWSESLRSPEVIPSLILAVMLLYRLRLATVLVLGVGVWWLVHSTQSDLADPHVGPLTTAFHLCGGLAVLIFIVVQQTAYHRRTAAALKRSSPPTPDNAPAAAD